jgi:hypothetical protein
MMLIWVSARCVLDWTPPVPPFASFAICMEMALSSWINNLAYATIKLTDDVWFFSLLPIYAY